MGGGWQLRLLGEAQAGLAFPLGDTPLRLGRAPTNEVVLSEGTVSWHHAVVWVEGGLPWVRDLGSRNGTFVNDEPVRGGQRLASGDRVRIGLQVGMEVVGRPTIDLLHARSFVLEELGSGAAVPFRSDRFHLGSGPDAHLHIPDAADRAATLLLHADGEVWLGTEDAERQLAVGEAFEVAGRHFVVREVDPTQAPTTEVRLQRYPYTVEATLNGPSGPEAVLRGPGVEHLVSADNRAILLYLLARQIVEDQAAGLGPDQVGWSSDDLIRQGIWGKKPDQDANSLHVLVYRLRAELKRAGFDPWFIEKRRKAIRLRATAQIS
jgi:hypothetical protein